MRPAVSPKPLLVRAMPELYPPTAVARPNQLRRQLIGPTSVSVYRRLRPLTERPTLSGSFRYQYRHAKPAADDAAVLRPTGSITKTLKKMSRSRAYTNAEPPGTRRRHALNGEPMPRCATTQTKYAKGRCRTRPNTNALRRLPAPTRRLTLDNANRH